MSKPFTQYKALYAAIFGYHPFNPDAGIFAGGYQGPLYPNPTTLSSPNTSFNPYLYQIPFPTPYTMKNTGDFYEGLGIGNPGINFRNAGHILGILDTYNRISYGLKIIKGIRSLSQADKFGTSVIINIPMLDGQTLAVIKTLSGSDIYPSFSEEPDDYIINFVDDTGLILDPRTSEPFNFDGDKHEPNVSIIDFNTLFTGLHIFSYRSMAEKFQDYFSQLITFAQTFPRIDEQKEVVFGSIPFLTPIIDIPKHYPFEGRLDFLNSADVEFNFSNFGIPAHRFGSNFKVLSRTDALKAMTGNDVFHKVNTNIYEYRSLTELNSVINIIPVQGYSFTFNCLTTDPSLLHVPPFPGAVQARFFVVFSIVDVIINILNLSDKSVSIDGSVLIEYLGTPNPFFQIQPDTLEKVILTPNPQIQRKISISTSHTNLFTWDRVWLGLEEFNDKTIETFSANHNITAFLQPVSSDTINFSKDFTLQQGNNCIRTRILSHSMGFVDDTFDYDKITTNLTINITDMAPIDYSFEAKAGQSFIV